MTLYITRLRLGETCDLLLSYVHSLINLMACCVLITGMQVSCTLCFENTSITFLFLRV